MTEGWEGLEEAVPPDVRGIEQAREDTDRLVVRVLNNPDGKKLLAWLRQIYVECPIATPGASADWGYYFEGRRFVILDLEARLKRALKPDDRPSTRRKAGKLDPGNPPF